MRSWSGPPCCLSLARATGAAPPSVPTRDGGTGLPARTHHSGEDSCRVRRQESTAHAYTSTVIDLLAERAPGLLKTLRDHDPDFVLLDGTPCRVRSGRRRPSRLLPQATAPRRERAGDHSFRWPAAVALNHTAGPHPRPDRCPHHRIIRICERQGVPMVADLAYQGGGPCRNSPLPRAPATGPWPRHGHPSNAALPS